MGQKQSSHPIILCTSTEHVIIHHGYKMHLQLNSLQTFPHGLDGLRLWEAGIVLARYVIHKSSQFKQKRVLELGAGVGIAGITAKKWTQSTQVDITDYNAKVLENIKFNLKKNQVECPVFNLDWTSHPQQPQKYDLIIASDVVYFGSPVKDLYQLLKERLFKGGKAMIVIPVRKNYAQLFLEQVKDDQFKLEVQHLEQEQYSESPLQNSAEGRKKYPLLTDLKFDVYLLHRK